MATFTGTIRPDTITPQELSTGVKADPAGSMPSAAADTINGASGDDTLDGGFGGDIINSGLGDDTISDGTRHWAGDDIGYLAGVNAGNVIHGNAGNDDIAIRIYDSGGANPADNVAYGDDGNDALMLKIHNDPDTAWAGDLPEGKVSLFGGTGDDLLQIREDYVKATAMTSALYGGPGNDDLRATVWTWEPDGSFNGGDNAERLYGGTGDDAYFVLEQKDTVVEKAGEGYDTVTADKTDYVLPANVEKLVMENLGYYAEDTFSGTGNALDNVIVGWSSSWADDGVGERLNGGAGNDTIYGSTVGDEAWNNVYAGQYDRDTIHGGTGNDVIHGSFGEVQGGDHTQLLDDDKLYGDAGNDEIFGLYGNDLIYGGTGDDLLWGQSENDTIRGGDGNDRLGGGSGNDKLYGDAGNDVISGTGGADQLTGGSGDDRFDYDYVTESTPGTTSRDTILDFAGVGATVGDRIDLSTIDANVGVSGNQAFVFGGIGVGHVWAKASGGDSLIQADIGAAAGPELEILVKSVAAGAWTDADFIL